MLGDARDRSALGRFPGVTLVDEEEAEEEDGDAQESTCRQWMRRACPVWCCRRSEVEDNTDTTVTGLDEAEEKPDGGGGEEPAPPGGDQPDGSRVLSRRIHRAHIGHGRAF